MEERKSKATNSNSAICRISLAVLPSILCYQIKAAIFKREYVVVATTRQNSTCSLLTSAKLSVGYLVVGITKELDKEPLLHCSSIYINTR